MEEDPNPMNELEPDQLENDKKNDPNQLKNLILTNNKIEETLQRLSSRSAANQFTRTFFGNPQNILFLIDTCSKKLETDPGNTKALYIRASSLLKAGKLKDCQADCDQLISLNESYSAVYYIRGCCFERQDKTIQAIRDYSILLELDPYHVNALFSRAACLNKIVREKIFYLKTTIFRLFLLLNRNALCLG